MVYLANTVLPAMRDWFYADIDGDRRRRRSCSRARATPHRRSLRASRRPSRRRRDYLVGGKLSTADFLAVVLMRWTRNMPRPATGLAASRALYPRRALLPSFIELNAREKLTGWRNRTIETRSKRVAGVQWWSRTTLVSSLAACRRSPVLATTRSRYRPLALLRTVARPAPTPPDICSARHRASNALSLAAS